MGRWAQQRRRGGGGGAPSSAPLPQITSVVANGTTSVLVTFDQALTFHAGPAGDIGSITVDGATYLSVTLNDAFSVIIDFLAVIIGGETWSLNTSPNAWEDEPCQLTSGLVTV